jgi:uncharacterized membrane protein YkoI
VLLAVMACALLASDPALADAHRQNLSRSDRYSRGYDGDNGNGRTNGELRNGRRDRAAIRIDRDEAAAIARRSVGGGRVLKVQLRGQRYYVKLLLAGERVRTVRVDATTGETG